MAPHLVGLGVAHFAGVLAAVVADVRLRLRSLLAHWQDRPMRKTLLLIGLEEGLFYQPELAPFDIRALVVVAIRNSLLEDLGSSSSSLLPPDLPSTSWPIQDEDIRSITQQAILYWQRADLEHLPPPVIPPLQDLFGNLKGDFPSAWNVLSRLAQAKTPIVSFPAPQTLPPTLPVPSIIENGPKKTVVLSGISPLFDSRLVGSLRAIQDGDIDTLFVDSWKMLTRHPQKLFRILDFVLAHGGSVLTHNSLLTQTSACSRQGLLRPARRAQEVFAKFQNQVGLTTAHRKALERVNASSGRVARDY